MDAELQRLFDFLIERGVNVFDTADSYGTGALNGRSEELLGRFMRESASVAKGRTAVHIATKLAGYPWRVTPWNMTAACRCAPRRCARPALPHIGLSAAEWQRQLRPPVLQRRKLAHAHLSSCLVHHMQVACDPLARRAGVALVFMSSLPDRCATIAW
jgi:aryl-alcohol dehydrogenase-like predicted oxidoreductase